MRESHIHAARVFLREAQKRRAVPQQRGFCFVLLQWAANSRRRAAAAGAPAQRDLFESPA